MHRKSRRIGALTLVAAVLLITDVRAASTTAGNSAVHDVVRIAVFPETLRLSGPRDHRQLIVTGYDNEGRSRDLTHLARIESGTPADIATDGSTVSIVPVAGSELSPSLPRESPSPPEILDRVPVPAARATGEYDLAADFYDNVETRECWSYELSDGRRLEFFSEILPAAAGDFPHGQSGWQASKQDALPLVGLALDPLQSGTVHDIATSRVFGHAPLVIRWTAPNAGTVAITGGVWMVRDLDRRVKVTLETSRFGSREALFRDISVPERDGDNDGREEGPNSTRPMSFAEAAHFAGQDPKRLTKFSLAEGDQIILTVAGGDFFGVDCGIRYLTPVPTFDVQRERIAGDANRKPEKVSYGSGNVLVTVGELSKEVPVEWPVERSVERVSFRYDVLPTITRLGCNAGACHASPNGKGGFHLSLRGYDTRTDWETIFYGESGRRVNLSSPETSLLLRKPSMDVPHGGGRRLHRNSTAYRTLRDWIAQGCGAEMPDAAECVRLDVYPPERTLPENSRTQQLVALAQFSDGTLRDVTPMAVFTSSDDETAQVDSTGRVKGRRRGQAAILVQYAEQSSTAYFSWTENIENFVWSSPLVQNFIDRLNFSQLRWFQIQPSALCTDSEFIRRLYLDVLGRLPSIEETERFLSDPGADKRQRLIDAVLLRPEFAEYWALKWADVLRVRNEALTPRGVQEMYDWLVSSVRENNRLDAFAKELLIAEGGTFHNPAANYYRAVQTPDDCAETTAELFLGFKIKCAKCHNHPFDRWTQDNYHGLAAFFSRVERQIVEPPKKEGSDQPAGDAEMNIQIADTGEAIHPRTGKPVSPWLPDVGPIDATTGDRRARFADWLVQMDNPFFSRVAVNRIWFQLFGRGLVHPIDDFRDSNPAVNRQLLDTLASDFTEHGFDRRQILRTILSSSTYQLSSDTNRWNETDDTFLSRSRPRRLSAEQLLDAICHVTEMPEQLGSFPAGTHATSMPSPDVNHPFLQSFGQPKRKSACACERTQEPGFAQALQMVNGDVVQRKLRAEENRFHRMLREGSSNDEVVQALYLAALCRRATEEEMEIALAHLATADEPERAVEDIAWVLLNTKEFLFRY